MDPVAMILAALVSGASAAVGDTAGAVIKDAYASLKALLRQRFAGNERAEVVLEDHEDDPETFERPLAKQLVATGADVDPEVLAAARALLEAVDRTGSDSGKYRVDLRGAQGVQVGDGGSMTVHLTQAPGPLAGP